MAGDKKPRGRPLERKYPPWIDATPEAIARAALNTAPGMAEDTEKVYRCAGCERAVWYPETMYRDGRCAGCTAAPDR